jgi:hypothetical protein
VSLLVLRINALLKVRPVAPAWNVPPPNVTVPVPTDEPFVTCNVPAEIVVPPEYPLVPLRITVPGPI